jgi:hypothetical protein
MFARQQIKLIAMPGADDMSLVWAMFLNACGFLGAQRFQNPFEYASLTHRAAHVGAIVEPGDDLILNPENAHFFSVTGHDLAVSFGKLVLLANKVFWH